MKPYYQSGGATLYLGDCIEVLPTLGESSIDIIVADPPYFKVKGEWWDRQWEKPAQFLAWIGDLCGAFRRVLKPNGSLYVFASPKMAARVECKVGEWFEVLSSVTWTKPNAPGYDGWHRKCSKGSLRQWYPYSERIIFAEHFGADSHAKGESGYGAECDRLRGFVFEPLRAYLDGERLRAGVRHRAVIGHLGMTGHDSHFFSPVQWKLPLPNQYEAMRALFNASSNGDGQQYLRREYEDLRQEYESLRRPFAVSADVPYTDVWDFPTVQAYRGKHPCEKPLAMIEHIVRASSRKGAVVLDPFCGSGVTGEACRNLGRDFVGIEIDKKWCGVARNHIKAAHHGLTVKDVEQGQRSLLEQEE